MSKYGEIRNIERKVRASVQYSEWVIRNKAAACLGCGSTDNLDLHHVVELYQLVLSFWKLYGDYDDAFAHTVASHQDDHVECVTFCPECHAKRHPGRVSERKFDPRVRVANWAAIPRNMPLHFSHSPVSRTNFSIGLVGFQVLLGLGWHVLNGHMDSRIVELNRRDLARLLGKSPGTSFNRSLDEAMDNLQRLDVILARHVSGNSVELHISPTYLKALADNPWFMSLDDARTSSMCALALRWFLGLQSNKKTYSIGLDKLKVHLGVAIRDDAMAARTIAQACDKTGWAKMKHSKGSCVFTIRRRGATPIFSLRRTLADSIERGR